jgi:hypothetical protein
LVSVLCTRRVVLQSFYGKRGVLVVALRKQRSVWQMSYFVLSRMVGGACSVISEGYFLRLRYARMQQMCGVSVARHEAETAFRFGGVVVGCSTVFLQTRMKSYTWSIGWGAFRAMARKRNQSAVRRADMYRCVSHYDHSEPFRSNSRCPVFVRQFLSLFRVPSFLGYGVRSGSLFEVARFHNRHRATRSAVYAEPEEYVVEASRMTW